MVRSGGVSRWMRRVRTGRAVGCPIGSNGTGLWCQSSGAASTPRSWNGPRAWCVCRCLTCCKSGLLIEGPLANSESCGRFAVHGRWVRVIGSWPLRIAWSSCLPGKTTLGMTCFPAGKSTNMPAARKSWHGGRKPVRRLSSNTRPRLTNSKNRQGKWRYLNWKAPGQRILGCGCGAGTDGGQGAGGRSEPGDIHSEDWMDFFGQPRLFSEPREAVEVKAEGKVAGVGVSLADPRGASKNYHSVKGFAMLSSPHSLSDSHLRRSFASHFRTARWNSSKPTSFTLTATSELKVRLVG